MVEKITKETSKLKLIIVNLVPELEGVKFMIEKMTETSKLKLIITVFQSWRV